ncbi:MAG: zf-HC2 domain-containing protein [Aggregatilineales bacterium]
MKTINCQTCRAHLPGYAARELPPRLRALVGAHLDACPACYGIYRRQRLLMGELEHTLPLVGQPDLAGLGRIWSAVQVEMKRPRPSAFQRVSKRQGATALLLLLVLLLPWSFDAPSMTRALPLLPTPAQETTQRAIAMATEGCACAASSRAPLAVPSATPPAQPNYVPELNDALSGPAATETP